jgi:hypothetical protein
MIYNSYFWDYFFAGKGNSLIGTCSSEMSEISFRLLSKPLKLLLRKDDLSFQLSEDLMTVGSAKQAMA